MLQGQELTPGPDPFLQETLVWDLALPADSALWISQDVLEGSDPLLPDGVLGDLGPPHPGHQWMMVSGVISHRVKRLLGLQPFLHGRHLPGGDGAVQVAADEDGDLGVQGGQEPSLRTD